MNILINLSKCLTDDLIKWVNEYLKILSSWISTMHNQVSNGINERIFAKFLSKELWWFSLSAIFSWISNTIWRSRSIPAECVNRRAFDKFKKWMHLLFWFYCSAVKVFYVKFGFLMILIMELLILILQKVSDLN